jgi:hypothetical protein
VTPLALQLQYLLTAFSATTTNGGDQEQFAHAALAAAMQALHANGVVGDSNPSLSPLAKPLVEPLRITLDSLDLESISKLWTATTQPLRLSVGYDVSLVVVDALDEHGGPPRPRSPARRRADHGPRLQSVDPPRISFGDEVLVSVEA